jgi:hypothetical protein
MILSTGITVDKPTGAGNIYPKEILNKVIKDFNIRCMNSNNRGSELNPNSIEELGEPTHITKRLFINESGVVCAEIELLKTKKGQELLNKIVNSNVVVARPIMIIPSFVFDIKDGKQRPNTNNIVINHINSIMRIQVDCRDK